MPVAEGLVAEHPAPLSICAVGDCPVCEVEVGGVVGVEAFERV